MKHFIVPLILSFLTSASAASAGSAGDLNKLTEKSYPAILSSLVKLPVDTHWREVPWRPSFTEAIIEARKADKPILLWIMNGHPCGMT